ncbi:hypothetical protein V6N13_000510 [Hibiscus sabdariffa]|uniref:Uncharacterized protein n=1 Tax=Hibiscus sabdariffa TaxID=183260 RepID=A0ABR2G5H2_9ROSI
MGSTREWAGCVFPRVVAHRCRVLGLCVLGVGRRSRVVVPEVRFVDCDLRSTMVVVVTTAVIAVTCTCARPCVM